MNRSFRTVIYLSLVVLGACKASETTTATETSATVATDAATTSSASATQTSSMAGAAVPYDLQFIDSLTKHHQMAVDMATAGAPKFANKALKDAAAKMVKDQSREIVQLKQWREQWYPAAASAESMQMAGMSGMNMDMSHMQMMSGKALDLMFIDMMVPHHEGALAMGKDALAKAEHQEIKDFSQKMIDSQTKEIAQMQQWKKAWTK